ncbi:MAG: aryl-sulfate sulfotransferase, partial [Candidatus Hodarchaeales archaeon]
MIKKTINIGSFLLLILIITISSQITLSNSLIKKESSNSYDYSSIGFGSIPQNTITLIENTMNITTYDSEKIMNGINMFSLKKTNVTTSRRVEGYVLFVDMQGNILAGKSGSTKAAGSDPELINASTVLLSENDNLSLWNLRTNVTVNYNIPMGHHDYEYNPLTYSFLILDGVNYGEYDGLPVEYDDIYEYDRDGNVLWFWNSSQYLPFNSDWFLNETGRGRNDWTHTNSIFWDINDDIIYYHPRNLDTFYKIDKNTGDVLWGLGKHGNFTLYDKDGNQKESLFYHAHSIERSGEFTFIVFDNDLYNSSNTIPNESRFSQMMEF